MLAGRGRGRGVGVPVGRGTGAHRPRRQRGLPQSSPPLPSARPQPSPPLSPPKHVHPQCPTGPRGGAYRSQGCAGGHRGSGQARAGRKDGGTIAGVALQLPCPGHGSGIWPAAAAHAMVGGPKLADCSPRRLLLQHLPHFTRVFYGTGTNGKK